MDSKYESKSRQSYNNILLCIMLEQLRVELTIFAPSVYSFQWLLCFDILGGLRTKSYKCWKLWRPVLHGLRCNSENGTGKTGSPARVSAHRNRTSFENYTSSLCFCSCINPCVPEQTITHRHTWARGWMDSMDAAMNSMFHGGTPDRYK